ncbi:MAG: hypothetical protein RL070_619 [Bacteroidota bacterium]|jgi:uncharacterized protein (TIGR02453 family)
MLAPATLQFLKALDKNNNKAWFDAHRKQYDAAKLNFAELTQQVITQFGKKEPSIALLQPKECVFRINRDVRFSKNKAPYKNNMGASIKAGGKKSLLAGYYIHLEPGGKSFVGGGLYMPDAAIVGKVRQEIDYNYTRFLRIVENKKFIAQYGGLDFSEGLSLVREPKGYEKENPAIKYLKLKSWIATSPLSDTALQDKNLATQLTKAFEYLQPLISFLNEALEA